MFFSIVSTVTFAVSCDPPEHPKNAQVGDEICGPMCTREHQCDAKVDLASCTNRCKNGLSPRSVYWSDHAVSDIRKCSEKQTCGGDIERLINSCDRDAIAGLTPSAAVQSFCAKRVEKDHVCGDLSSDVEHCVFGHKMYSDAIVSQLNDCIDDPCNHYGRCMIAIVGDDAADMDKDRIKDFQNHAVPKARTAVVLSGKVVVYNETQSTVAGARICVHGNDSIPCVASGDGGAFSITLPASTDLAIEVTPPAPEFAPILFGFSARNLDAPNFVVGVPRAASLVKRYAAFNVTYPDTATGFIHATATLVNMQAEPAGFQGSIAPASGTGPFVLSDEKVDEKKVSKFRTVLFAGVAPGTVELTFAPSSLSCTPSFGAWSTGKPNTVKAPVAAGFETEVYQRCSNP